MYLLLYIPCELKVDAESRTIYNRLRFASNKAPSFFADLRISILSEALFYAPALLTLEYC